MSDQATTSGALDHVEWEAPQGAPRTRYADLFDELRLQPGEWGVVYRGPSFSETARRLRGKWGPRGFEFYAERGKTFARYVGDEA